MDNKYFSEGPELTSRRHSALISSDSALFIIWEYLNSADQALNSTENANFQS